MISDTSYTLQIYRSAYRQGYFGATMSFIRKIVVQGQTLGANGTYYRCHDVDITADLDNALITNQDTIEVDMFN